jgi:hypothetical protein
LGLRPRGRRLAALAIWSATDENWSGVIVSIVLGALAVVALLRTRRTSA